MKPLFINWDPQNEQTESLVEKVKTGIQQYKEEYKQYFERNKNEGDVMFEAAPRVILIPGVGMVNTGRNVAMANVSGALTIERLRL